jgi:carboxymethylenebutenolidase
VWAFVWAANWHISWQHVPMRMPTVSYYGVDIDKNLAEATKIQKPLILHMSGNDEYVSPSAQATIQQGLKDNPLVTIYRYEGVNHGFSRVG